MALNFGTGLFGASIFDAQPDDGQVMSAAGSRRIPVNQTIDTHALDWKGDWSNAVTYQISDWVEHNGAAYQCIEAHSNDEPPSAKWDLISSDTDTDTHALEFKGQWSGATAYVLNDWVENDGAAYACNQAHTNQEPPNASYWDLVSSDTDTDTQALDYKADWGSGPTYVVDDWVTHAGALYKCQLESTNNEPPNATYWILVSSDTQTKEVIYRWADQTNGTVTDSAGIVSVQLGTNGNAIFTFKLPNDFNVLTNSSFLMVPNATETIQWDLQTFAVELGENVDTEGSFKITNNMQLAVTDNIITEADITPEMPDSMEALDWIGVKFSSDTDHTYVAAIRIRYL